MSKDEKLIVKLSLGAERPDGRKFADAGITYYEMDETHFTAMEILFEDFEKRLLQIGVSRCDEKKLKAILAPTGVEIP